MEASNDEKEMMMASLFSCSAVFLARAARTAKTNYGSQPGHRPNRDLGINEAGKHLESDFFCRLYNGRPAFSEDEVERTYRMLRDVYEKIREAAIM